MASIYKPTYIDPKTGKRVKSKTYRIAYKDHTGKRVVAPGFTDKAATEAKAAELVKKSERIKAGLDEPAAVTHKIFETAIESYLKALEQRGSPPNGPHIKESKRILTKIMISCGWPYVNHVNQTGFQAFFANNPDMSARTRNRYQETLRAFLNYCVDVNWLRTNPVEGIKMTRVGNKGRKRIRRAYAAAEYDKLIDVAPEPRKSIYKVALTSGLRRKEMQQLTRLDCDPRGKKPTWTLRPEITKTGKKETLPMLPECAEVLLPIWESVKKDDQLLFSSIPHIATLHKDLAKAGIPRQDSRGRWADFHSFRYTFCTCLARKLPIQHVKRLMRHSTIKLTADLYLDLGIEGSDDQIYELFQTY